MGTSAGAGAESGGQVYFSDLTKGGRSLFTMEDGYQKTWEECTGYFRVDEERGLSPGQVEWPHYEPKSPNDSGYGMGSGDCYASDDEDCYGEGSADGSGSQEGGVGGSPYDDDDNDDDDEGSGGWETEVDEGPKWPPWTVTQVPPKDDVMLEENNNNSLCQQDSQAFIITTSLLSSAFSVMIMSVTPE